MHTALILDPIFKKHITSPGHPERVERLTAIESALARDGLIEQCVRIAPEPAEEKWILSNHSREYVARLKQAAHKGAPYIDCVDSSICKDSFEVALNAVGGALKVVDGVIKGNFMNGFCAVRPPGHHAEYGESMGFCLFNTIAIAARFALQEHGLERVLIFDWDVHHGNGTQHSFEESPEVFFCSMHGHPATLYPGTGFPEETGKGKGKGFTLNIAMPPGSGNEQYRSAFEENFLPVAHEFKPQLVLISAGFDAHERDPIGNQKLETESYGWFTQQMIALANEHCGGKIVSLLEGGYDLAGLSDSVAIHLRELLNARSHE